jgi:hypothetical protein
MKYEIKYEINISDSHRSETPQSPPDLENMESQRSTEKAGHMADLMTEQEKNDRDGFRHVRRGFLYCLCLIPAIKPWAQRPLGIDLFAILQGP